MASNLVKRVMLKIVADDGDTEHKIDAIARKADELAAKHPELKPRVDSAAASAKLAVLRQELKATAKDAEQPHKFSLSGLVPAIGEMSMFQKVMLGFNVATSFAEPLLAGVTVAAGGLASGLAAAGAGLGVFGLVAKSVYGQASTAATAYAAAQKQVAVASTAAQRTAGLHAERVALFGLSPPVKALTLELGNVHSMWQKFTDAAAPGVVGVIGQGIGILTSHFGILRGFLPPVETALSHIMADVNRGLNSQGFTSFIHDLQANAGPALEKVAGVIGHIAVGAAGIIRAFMPEAQSMLSLLDKGTAKFAHWGQTLTQHSGFQSLMSMFKSETPLAVHTLANLAGVVKALVSDMTGLDGIGNSKTLLQIAMPFTSLLKVLVQANPELVRAGLYLLAASSGAKKVSAAFDGVKSGVSTVQSIASAVSGLPGKLSSAGSFVTGLGQKLGILRTATEGETVAQEGLDGAMDANPIGLIIMAIAALVVGIVELWKHSSAFRDFWKGVWKIVKETAIAGWHQLDNDVFHPIMHIVGEVVSFVRTHWRLLAEILGTVLLGPVGALVVYVVTHFRQIETGASHLVSNVTGWFRRLPGRILHAIGDLGHLLWNGGVNLIMGLVHGIESVASAPLHALGSIVSDLRSLLPFSPAKKGPLSGSGSPDIAGRKITQMLAQGIDSGRGTVAAASARMAGALVPHVTGVPLGGGGGGGVLRLEVRGGSGMSGLDHMFMTWLQHQVRALGGDPTMFTRKVAFR